MTNNGAQVLDAVRSHIERFVAMPSQAALDIATVWCCHTHVVDQKQRMLFDSTPRIAFVSDAPASGKTAALDLVGRLALNGQRVIDPTPATYADMVDTDRATILVDEIDLLFGATGNSKQTLRGQLNAGYKRGTFWKRANKTKVDVFAPLALAGLGSKFRTAPALEPLRTRSVIIEMQPVIHRDDDPDGYEPYRARLHSAVTDAIRADLSRWARGNADLISQTWPQDIPKGIDNRLREVCEPLFQCSDAAQGHWPDSIRTAASELLLGQVTTDPDELTLTDSLLVSLRKVFADRAKMATMDICDQLYADRSASWSKLWPNRNTAPRELAMILAPLGVEPQPVDLDGHTLRGYHRWALEPLWAELDEEITSLAVS